MPQRTPEMGDGAAIARQFDDAEQQRNASDLGMWVFLASEILFFGVFRIVGFCDFHITDSCLFDDWIKTMILKQKRPVFIFTMRTGRRISAR